MIDVDKVYDIMIEQEGEYPDFVDSYLLSGCIDGRYLTDDEVERINADEPEWIYQNLIKQIF